MSLTVYAHISVPHHRHLRLLLSSPHNHPHCTFPFPSSSSTINGELSSSHSHRVGAIVAKALASLTLTDSCRLGDSHKKFLVFHSPMPILCLEKVMCPQHHRCHIGPLPFLFSSLALDIVDNWLLQSKRDSSLSCALVLADFPCSSKCYPSTPLSHLRGAHVFCLLLKQFSSKPLRHQERAQARFKLPISLLSTPHRPRPRKGLPPHLYCHR